MRSVTSNSSLDHVRQVRITLEIGHSTEIDYADTTSNWTEPTVTPIILNNRNYFHFRLTTRATYGVTYIQLIFSELYTTVRCKTWFGYRDGSRYPSIFTWTLLSRKILSQPKLFHFRSITRATYDGSYIQIFFVFLYTNVGLRSKMWFGYLDGSWYRTIYLSILLSRKLHKLMKLLPLPLYHTSDVWCHLFSITFPSINSIVYSKTWFSDLDGSRYSVLFILISLLKKFPPQPKLFPPPVYHESDV